MQKEIALTFRPEMRQTEAEAGETIWDVAHRAGIYIRGECNGKGLCGKCMVITGPSENVSAPGEEEKALLPDNGSDSKKRLACKAKISGPLTILIPFVTSDDKPVSGKTGISATFSRDPMIRRFLVTSPLIRLPLIHRTTGLYVIR